MPRDEANGRLQNLMRPLAACAEGSLPPNVALMQLLMAAESERDADDALKHAILSEQREAAVRRIRQMRRLWNGSPGCFAAVSSIAALARQSERCGEKARLEEISALFDRVHAISPDAGVALYSLGEASLLKEATREIVSLIEAWNLCGRQSRVLDLGCGTGRMLEALAPRVGEITGTDISQAMVETAARRISWFPNASVVRTSGRDITELKACFDLVLAIDSFPYLVQADVAEAHIAGCAALLRERGYVLIMNYSYRGDVAKDSDDLARLAMQYGFSVLRSGSRDLKLWDGTTFLLQKKTNRATRPDL